MRKGIFRSARRSNFGGVAHRHREVVRTIDRFSF